MLVEPIENAIEARKRQEFFELAHKLRARFSESPQGKPKHLDFLPFQLRSAYGTWRVVLPLSAIQLQAVVFRRW